MNNFDDLKDRSGFALTLLKNHFYVNLLICENESGNLEIKIERIVIRFK